jgi:ATP-dependent Clp protease adapter protein ClpS
MQTSLYNDPMNKREFVARCLVEICSLGDGEAFTVMMNAHRNGLSVVGIWQRELAEMYKQRLEENGLFVDMVPHDDGGDGDE